MPEDDDTERVRLVYDDLIPAPGRELPAKLRIPVLETTSSRNDFLIGLEIFGTDAVIFSTLSELSTHCCRCANELLRFVDLRGNWPGDAEVGQPSVNMFMIRKSDHSRLCLATGARNGNTVHDDYGSGTTATIRFAIEGTGFRDSPGLFNKITVEVRMEVGSSNLLTAVDVDLEEDNWEEIIDSSVESLLQVVESPGFASRWVAPCTAPPVKSESVKSQVAKKMRTAAPGSVSNALQLLTETVIVRSKPPAVMTLVFAQLEVKDLMQASEVSRSWRTAAQNDHSWTAIFKREPLLTKLEEPWVSRKQLCIQQAQAKKLVAVPLAEISYKDYCWAIEVYISSEDSDDEDSHTMLMSVLAPVAVPVGSFDDTFTILSCAADEAVGAIELEVNFGEDPQIAVCLSLLRKRDSKRLFLFDTQATYEDDFIRGEKCHAPFEGVDTFACASFYATVILQDEDYDDEWESTHTRRIKGVDVDLEGYAAHQLDGLSIVTLSGLLQMVECPGYKHLWV